MNNSQISNPKTELPTGIEMNEKDYMMSLLTCLKDLEKNYTVAMTEASNESLFNSFASIFEQIAELQRETYEAMFRKGWYSLEPAENEKINQKYQLLYQEYQELELE